jgi:hypothetical protein
MQSYYGFSVAVNVSCRLNSAAALVAVWSASRDAVRVPVEPTFEMVGAARISGAEGTDEQIASDIRAAIAASPEVP